MKAKSVAFVKSSEDNDSLDSTSVYQPFLMSGFVSLSADSEVRPITILRDTGAAQSIILDSVLPFSAVTYTGSELLSWECVQSCQWRELVLCWAMIWLVVRFFF